MSIDALYHRINFLRNLNPLVLFLLLNLEDHILFSLFMSFSFLRVARLLLHQLKQVQLLQELELKLWKVERKLMLEDLI